VSTLIIAGAFQFVVDRALLPELERLTWILSIILMQGLCGKNIENPSKPTLQEFIVVMG
jgi:hypothetical protein